jgi:hypothetical protein
MNVIYAIAAVMAGALVGGAFARLQLAALRRHQARLDQGRSINALLSVPGSFSRVALVLIALVLMQIVFPALFPGINKWCVSAGVVLSYGWMLAQRLRRSPTR